MSTTREVSDSIARRSLPFSAFKNEAEWRETATFLTDAIDEALQAERERCALILEKKRDQRALDIEPDCRRTHDFTWQVLDELAHTVREGSHRNE